MKVKWEESAKADFIAAKEHKENSPRTNLRKFVYSILDTAESLSFMPLRHPKVPTRDYRYIIDQTYEYKICYEVIEDVVHILYLQHPKEARH